MGCDHRRLPSPRMGGRGDRGVCPVLIPHQGHPACRASRSAAPLTYHGWQKQFSSATQQFSTHWYGPGDREEYSLLGQQTLLHFRAHRQPKRAAWPSRQPLLLQFHIKACLEIFNTEAAPSSPVMVWEHAAVFPNASMKAGPSFEREQRGKAHIRDTALCVMQECPGV